MDNELNKWLAINVMGWELRDNGDNSKSWYAGETRKAHEVCLDFTENIADAWMIIEKLAEIEGHIETILFHGKNENHCHIDIEHKTHDAKSDSAPMAICLAAKKAMEDKQ